MRRNEAGELFDLTVGDILGPPELPNWSGAPVEITAVGDGDEVPWVGISGDRVIVRVGTQSRGKYDGYAINSGDAAQDEEIRIRLRKDVGMTDVNGIRKIIGSWAEGAK